MRQDPIDAYYERGPQNGVNKVMPFGSGVITNCRNETRTAVGLTIATEKQLPCVS